MLGVEDGKEGVEVGIRVGKVDAHCCYGVGQGERGVVGMGWIETLVGGDNLVRDPVG